MAINIYVTPHARQRLYGRMAHLVNSDELLFALRGREYGIGETHVLVKRVQKSSFTDEDGIVIRGDQVWAVVKRRPTDRQPALVTIMLRGSGQPQRGDFVIIPGGKSE